MPVVKTLFTPASFLFCGGIGSLGITQHHACTKSPVEIFKRKKYIESNTALHMYLPMQRALAEWGKHTHAHTHISNQSNVTTLHINKMTMLMSNAAFGSRLTSAMSRVSQKCSPFYTCVTPLPISGARSNTAAIFSSQYEKNTHKGIAPERYVECMQCTLFSASPTPCMGSESVLLHRCSGF